MLANIIDRELLRSWLSLKLLSRLDAHGQKNITIFFWMGQLVNQPVFNKHLLCVSPMLGVSPNIQGIQKKKSMSNLFNGNVYIKLERVIQ